MSSSSEQIRYSDRFASFCKQALYRSLGDELQAFVREIGFRYRLTFQELRQVAEIAADLQMWKEPSLAEQWPELEQSSELVGKERKNELLRELKDRWLRLRNTEIVYKPGTVTDLRWSRMDRRKVITRENNNPVFGWCPVASERTICCNLRTIDAVQGCALACSYCSIQTFYDPGNITIQANLSEKLRNVELDPEKNYHIGSGQSSDSLILGNRTGILDAQLEFARMNSNVILEFKTKSKNVGHLLKTDVPANVFVSWSLNPQVIVDHEEHLTASLTERLNAAHMVADKGISVGFHLHPMVHYRGWKNDYLKLIETLLSMFSVDEVTLVSLGTLTFIKPTIKSLRLRGIQTKVLQIPMEEVAGKLSYPIQIKEEMFRTAWDAFGPWHDRVFFYLCMENRDLWESVFGFCYEDNEAFEEALFNHVSRKMVAKHRLQLN